MGAAISSPREEPAAEAPSSPTESGPLKLCPTCAQRYPDDYAVCPRDATPLVRQGGTGDPLIGQVLGDTYEIVRTIGEGGMGRVYEARHVRLGRRVALKLLHAHFVTEAESVARFRREASAASAVTSPHITQVFDVHATRDGRPYLVCELLEGSELGAVLKTDRTLEVPRAVAIARQVCTALGSAHAAGVVHRDLKPENIMLVRGPSGGDFVKVLDFGIAKSFTQNDSLTRTGVVLGTPAYMAPEQARSSAGLDHRVDIYALGAVLYRALTGSPPFAGDEPSAVLTAVLYEEPVRPKTLRKDLPEGLEVVVQRAMSKDPDERYSSMAEFDAALAPFGALVQPSTEPAAGPVRGPAVGAIDHAETVALEFDPSTAGLPASAGNARARKARPRALAYGALALSWCMLLLGSIVGAVIHAITARPLAAAESVLALVVAASVTVPLAVVWVRGLFRGAWRNTATMLARADLLATMTAASFAAYALVSVALRAIYLIGYRSPEPPRWTDIAALACALAAPLLRIAWTHQRG